MESPIGSIFTYSPLILLLTLSCTHELAAAISAWSVNMILFIIDYYRSQYRQDIPFPNFLKTIELISFTIIVICCLIDIDDFSPKLFGPIILSSLSLGILLSVIVSRPFTLQFSRQRVSPEVASSPKFIVFNNFISMYWFMILTCSTICVWVAYFFQPDCTSTSSGSSTTDQVIAQIFGTVIPLLLPMIGFGLMPRVITYLRSRMSQQQQQPSSSTSQQDDNNNNNNNGAGHRVIDEQVSYDSPI
jgi:hypothetical protein